MYRPRKSPLEGKIAISVTKKKSLRAPKVEMQSTSTSEGTIHFRIADITGTFRIEKKKSPVDSKTFEYSESYTGIVTLTYPNQTQQSYVVFQDNHECVEFPEWEHQESHQFTAQYWDYYQWWRNPAIMVMPSQFSLGLVLQYHHHIVQSTPIKFRMFSAYSTTRKCTETSYFDLIIFDIRTADTLREKLDKTIYGYEVQKSSPNSPEYSYNRFGKWGAKIYYIKDMDNHPNKIAVTCSHYKGQEHEKGIARIFEMTPNALCESLKLIQKKTRTILESPCEQYIVTKTTDGLLSIVKKYANKARLLWTFEKFPGDVFSFLPNEELLSIVTVDYDYWHFKILKIDLKTGVLEVLNERNEHLITWAIDEEGALTVWNGDEHPWHYFCKERVAKEKRAVISELLSDSTSLFKDVRDLTAEYIVFPDRVLTTQYEFSTVSKYKSELISKHLASVAPAFEVQEEKFKGKKDPYVLVAEYIGSVPGLTFFTPKREPHQFISFFRFSKKTQEDIQRLYEHVANSKERQAIFKLLHLAGRKRPDKTEIPLDQCLERTLNEFNNVLPKKSAVLVFLKAELENYRSQSLVDPGPGSW